MHDLLETHRNDVRRLLARYGGTEIDTAGDGFLVTFDSPTPAIECALAMSLASRSAGLEIRVGLHSGEVVFESRRRELEWRCTSAPAWVAPSRSPGEVAGVPDRARASWLDRSSVKGSVSRYLLNNY